jgi:tetratricopeptide (TPR) repeat protein
VRFYQDEAQDLALAWKWAARMERAFASASLTSDALGWLAWAEGDEEQALAHYERATSAPDGTIQPWTFGRAGNIYMERGEYPRAQLNFERALALTSSGSAPLSSRLVAALLAQEKCGEAQDVLALSDMQAPVNDTFSQRELEAARAAFVEACDHE